MKATRSMGRSIALNPSLPGTDVAAEELGPVEPSEEQRDDTRGSWSSGCSADRMKPRLERGREETCEHGNMGRRAGSARAKETLTSLTTRGCWYKLCEMHMWS